MQIGFAEFLAAIGIIGGIVTLAVSLSTLLTRRDGKIIQTAKTETTLSEIKYGVSELRIEVKSGFKEMETRLSRVEADIGKLQGRVDAQENQISLANEQINRAHKRLDDLSKGG